MAENEIEVVLGDCTDECCTIAESMIEEIERIWQEETASESLEPAVGIFKRKILRRIRSVADIAI